MIRFSRVQLAFVAAGIVAIALGANAPRALGSSDALQYVTNSTVQMPGILKMFGAGKNASSTSTTTISAERTRHDDGKGNTVIVQCDLKRVVNIDDNAKTYSVLNFDDMMNEMSAAMKAAQAKSGSPAPKINGSGSMTFSFDEKPDDQTQTIAGMTAHHAVDTMTMTSTGTGDCPSASFSMSMDVWYAPSPIKMSCPMKLPSAAPSGHAANPCMQNMMVQASNVRGTQGRIPLKTVISIPMGPMTMTTTEQVTSVKTIPYDASFFDIPAGYTKVDAMTSTTPH
ncbi:MAG TPA: hypothetical protein VKT51_10090 [Candidatus Eremiobacteraceae bacterium]|nr:hypothetical protein [Candidatus Eremiobacteraceae bacterium]